MMREINGNSPLTGFIFILNKKQMIFHSLMLIKARCSRCSTKSEGPKIQTLASQSVQGVISDWIVVLSLPSLFGS